MAAKKNKSMARARGNVLKTLVLIAFFFVICWVTNIGSYLMEEFGYPVDVGGWFYNFTIIMLDINCCINPIIYCFKYEQFQRGVVYVFCRNKVKTFGDANTGVTGTNTG